MAGREKIKLYQYDTNGKYLKMYKSYQEVKDLYYQKTERPFFCTEQEKEFHILPDNTVICKERAGREAVKRFLLRVNNPYLVTELRKKQSKVQVYNIDKVLIAEFQSISIAALMLNMRVSGIHSIIKASWKAIATNKHGFYIKYKDGQSQ